MRADVVGKSRKLGPDRTSGPTEEWDDSARPSFAERLRDYDYRPAYETAAPDYLGVRALRLDSDPFLLKRATGNHELPVKDLRRKGLTWDDFSSPLNRDMGNQITAGNGFGARDGGFHFGADLDSPLLLEGQHQPVYTLLSGTVVLAGDSKGRAGIRVVIDHKNGVVTKYFHATEVSVKPGEYIKAGTLIMLTGNTPGFSRLNSKSMKEHLHFELWIDNQAIDPKPLLERLLMKP